MLEKAARTMSHRVNIFEWVSSGYSERKKLPPGRLLRLQAVFDDFAFMRLDVTLG